MSVKKLVIKLKSLIQRNKFDLVDKPIEIIVVLFNTESGFVENDLNDLRRAIDFITDDYKVSLIDTAQNKISQDSLNICDFVIVLGNLGGHIDKHLRKIKNIQVPKGILITNDNITGKITNTSFYQVVWFFDFDLAKSISHPRKFHAFSNKNELTEYTKDTPNWDYEYYGNQMRKGITSVIKNKTKISNRLYSNARLKVGKDSFYNSNFQIHGHDSYVEIGSYCSIGNNLKIYTANHDINFVTTQGYLYRKNFKTDHPGEIAENPTKARTKGPIIIGNDVWIGDDVKIMSGVKIGNGACVAASSIVTKNVEDYAIVGGIPAKHIKYRFSENVIKSLLSIKWWEWSESKILKNKDFFYSNLNEVNIEDNFKIDE